MPDQNRMVVFLKIDYRGLCRSKWTLTNQAVAGPDLQAGPQSRAQEILKCPLQIIRRKLRIRLRVEESGAEPGDVINSEGLSSVTWDHHLTSPTCEMEFETSP